MIIKTEFCDCCEIIFCFQDFMEFWVSYKRCIFIVHEVKGCHLWWEWSFVCDICSSWIDMNGYFVIYCVVIMFKGISYYFCKSDYGYRFCLYEKYSCGKSNYIFCLDLSSAFILSLELRPSVNRGLSHVKKLIC